MRKLFYFVIAATAFAGCDRPVKGANGEIFSSAVQYNNYIIERQKRVSRYINSFYDELNVDLDSAEKLVSKTVPRIGQTFEEIKGMPPYRGDSAFRNAAIGSFGFYKSLFDSSYPQLITLHRKSQNLSTDEQQSIQQIVDRIIRDEEEFDKNLHNTQKDFAEKNNIRLTEPKKTEK